VECRLGPLHTPAANSPCCQAVNGLAHRTRGAQAPRGLGEKALRTVRGRFSAPSHLSRGVYAPARLRPGVNTYPPVSLRAAEGGEAISQPAKGLLRRLTPPRNDDRQVVTARAGFHSAGLQRHSASLCGSLRAISRDIAKGLAARATSRRRLSACVCRPSGLRYRPGGPRYFFRSAGMYGINPCWYASS